jgi:hypothetical protein
VEPLVEEVLEAQHHRRDPLVQARAGVADPQVHVRPDAGELEDLAHHQVVLTGGDDDRPEALALAQGEDDRDQLDRLGTGSDDDEHADLACRSRGLGRGDRASEGPGNRCERMGHEIPFGR